MYAYVCGQNYESLLAVNHGTYYNISLSYIYSHYTQYAIYMHYVQYY